LQILPARQLAVLIMPDYSDTTRARWPWCSTSPTSQSPALSNRPAPACNAACPTEVREPPPTPNSPAEHAFVAEIVRAHESNYIDTLIPLRTVDASISIPLEYHGRDEVARFFAYVSGSARRCDRAAARQRSTPSASTCAPTGQRLPRDRHRRPHPHRRQEQRQ
jgi:RNA polymerase sigma-70 factor (ECF subfamily)